MPSADDGDPAVVLEEVSVRYLRGAIGLDRISLRIRHGERIALVGSSGAGKSSLINLLNGRVALDGATVAGHVEVLGAEPSRLSGRALRRHCGRIGTMRQSFDLVGPMQVVHNVNAGRLATWSTPRALWSLLRAEHPERVADLLELVGLERTLSSTRVDQLSGGQQQRVALARLLAQEPVLALADEPVSSLDPELSSAVLELLAQPPTSSGWTLLVSVHQPEVARPFVDRMIGLRAGRVVFDEPADAVDDDRLAALYLR